MWNEQPAGKDHPWRYMPFHAMTPHTSGVTIDAQVLQMAQTRMTQMHAGQCFKLIIYNGLHFIV